AATVWTTLIRAKLARTLKGTSDHDPAKLADVLRADVIELGAYNHPLIDEMAKNEGLLKRWLKNWYASTHGYTFQMTSIAKRCAPESEISAFVPTMFRNLSDELADEFSKTPHHHLRHRILE